jgi:hypothetical protein
LHGGFLWLDKKYPTDENTMHRVSGLPLEGEEPTKAIKAKDASHEEIYTKYAMCRVSYGVVIIDIND